MSEYLFPSGRCEVTQHFWFLLALQFVSQRVKRLPAANAHLSDSSVVLQVSCGKTPSAERERERDCCVVMVTCGSQVCLCACVCVCAVNSLCYNTQHTQSHFFKNVILWTEPVTVESSFRLADGPELPLVGFLLYTTRLTATAESVQNHTPQFYLWNSKPH